MLPQPRDEADAILRLEHLEARVQGLVPQRLAEVPVFGQVPSYVAFQQSELQTFWPALVGAIAIIEVFSIIPAFENPNVEGWAIKKDHVAGDYGFDPLGLKPTDPAELKAMKTREINNGRLAMIGVAGMLGQELATNNKLF